MLPVDTGKYWRSTTLFKPVTRMGLHQHKRRAEFKRRADDNEESLRQRLMEYYKKTSPLIGYYYAKGNLRTVDGLAEIEDVAKDIAHLLG